MSFSSSQISSSSSSRATTPSIRSDYTPFSPTYPNSPYNYANEESYNTESYRPTSPGMSGNGDYEPSSEIKDASAKKTTENENESIQEEEAIPNSISSFFQMHKKTSQERKKSEYTKSDQQEEPNHKKHENQSYYPVRQHDKHRQQQQQHQQQRYSKPYENSDKKPFPRLRFALEKDMFSLQDKVQEQSQSIHAYLSQVQILQKHNLQMLARIDHLERIQSEMLSNMSKISLALQSKLL
jgi:hypothetical protein